MFDIHKIRPIHGWREFWGEVGIIVLGVLIALCLEQLAEAIHWRHKVSEARDALEVSVKVHALAAIEQQVVEPCVIEQLNHLEARLFAKGEYQPVKLYVEPTFIYAVRAPSRPWGDSVWSTITGEGTSTHFDPKFRSTIDRFYASLAQNGEIARQVDQLSGRLNALSLPITRDPATVAQFARDIEEFRAKEAYLTLVSGQVLADLEDVKMTPSKAYVHDEVFERSGTITFCRKNHLPLANPHPISTKPVSEQKAR